MEVTKMENSEFLIKLLIAGVLICVSLLGFRLRSSRKLRRKGPPVVPGLPLLGNLLQLREKKPHYTFTQWARKYGPIYSIRTGANPLVVLNSSQVAKEAMVTKYSSISTRKLPKALEILTREKCMIAMSDYGDFHRMVKKMVLNNLLGATAQKQSHQRSLRECMMQNMVSKIYSELQAQAHQIKEGINIRQIIVTELFPLAMKQVLGHDVDSVYVEELGTKISKWEIYEKIVIEPMKGAIEVDWRDFFPYLRWVPRNTVQENMKQVDKKRNAVVRAVIEDYKKLPPSSKNPNCYLDILLKECAHLTDKELEMSIWEPLIEASDTTLVTIEWAMFELSKNPQAQDRLYREIQRVCGNEVVTEDYLPKMPYLSAVFQETLRKHPPVPIIPLRYVHEDVELGGFFVPAGSEIAINIYGCHYDEKEWKNTSEWNPERFEECRNGDILDLYKTMAFGSEFNWELAFEEEDSVDTVVLTTHKLHPLKAIPTPRKKP
ncbi:hypothetical protein SUGI_0494470 [Cryptomeria japonica]|nr:hypothetical protein SUGI_0494470 [Cryptomeria japonica]